MRNLALACLLLTLAGCAFAADSGKDVTLQSGDETVHGLLLTPEGRGPFPALVVIHEWWGLNDWVKEQAAKWTAQGYVTLAVDLYRGRVAKDPDEAHELMRGLPDDRAIRDMRAAVAYLQAQKNVKKTHVGSIGWCMGGSLSFTLAENEPALRVAVVNYGHMATDPAILKPIKARVLGLFGGQDRGIPPADVNQTSDAMKALGKKMEVQIYDDAGHGFQNPGNKSYNAADTEDAWKRTVAFLDANLKK